jgi:hypothetical protein
LKSIGGGDTSGDKTAAGTSTAFTLSTDQSFSLDNMSGKSVVDQTGSAVVDICQGSPGRYRNRRQWPISRP